MCLAPKEIQLALQAIYSRSSAEEQLGDIEKVGGSIPLVSTKVSFVGMIPFISVLTFECGTVVKAAV